jgi:hypothetical protein
VAAASLAMRQDQKCGYHAAAVCTLPWYIFPLRKHICALRSFELVTFNHGVEGSSPSALTIIDTSH